MALVPGSDLFAGHDRPIGYDAPHNGDVLARPAAGEDGGSVKVQNGRLLWLGRLCIRCRRGARSP